MGGTTPEVSTSSETFDPADSTSPTDAAADPAAARSTRGALTGSSVAGMGGDGADVVAMARRRLESHTKLGDQNKAAAAAVAVAPAAAAAAAATAAAMSTAAAAVDAAAVDAAAAAEAAEDAERDRFPDRLN